MSRTRRDVLVLGAASLAVGATTVGATGEIAGQHDIKAIAFDAFPIFDPRPIFLLAEELFPGRGAELADMWRTRQFEYTWLRAMSQRYADFWQVTTDALVFSAKSLRLELSDEKRVRLLQAYLELKPWPDAVDALKSLKDAGLRLVFLSNLTPGMLQAAVKSSGLEGMFEHLISTDAIGTYKPDPRAYQLGIDALKLRREEVLFVAFAGWDAVGAKSFGYTTFWVNRQNLPLEELGVSPDAVGATLGDLVGFLKV
jgi:2-haloacid dehalogenase